MKGTKDALDFMQKIVLPKTELRKYPPWIPTFAGIQGFFSVPGTAPNHYFFTSPQRHAGGNGQVVNPGLKGIVGLVLA